VETCKVVYKDDPHNLTLLYAFSTLGKALQLKGNFSDAVCETTKALEIGEQYGKQNVHVASSHRVLGEIMLCMGDCDGALANFEKGLEICRKVYGKEHLEIARYYDCVGDCFRHMQKPHNALNYHGWALQIRVKWLGKNHPDVASTLIRIGETLHRFDDYDKALTTFCLALDIFENTFGKERAYSHVGDCYNSISIALIGKQDFDGALVFNTRALEVQKAICREEHYGTSNYLFNRGNIKYYQKQYDEALDLHFQSLSYRLKNIDHNPLHLADSFFSIAKAFDAQGDRENALNYYQESLKVHLDQPKRNEVQIALLQALILDKEIF
jgi:tetratricopeptide (TPR) repeat protein